MQGTVRTTLAALLAFAVIVASDNHTGLLSVPPSLYWDGIDGQWSTFLVQIGTPAQTVHVLPGTSANAGNTIMAVLPQGCDEANPNLAGCADLRGSLFFSNQSTTWNTQRLSNGGLFDLGDYEEKILGLDGNAYYGFDTVQLGAPGSGLPSVTNQIVAGFATNDFWLGSLGLSPIPLNFTNFNSPVPSFLTSLRQKDQIGSTSWAYTAGAQYQSPPVFGSLTLGGYDNARFNSSAALTGVPFGADFSRDLLIGVKSISSNTLGSPPLLSKGIYAFIDSMVSHMWLPIDACEQFEKAFNLTWNATAELYLLTDYQHQHLLDQNPTITFSLAASTDPSSNGPTTEIQIPYAAFDLNITAPYVDSSTRYFPLKRAQNETQYTLGRVFLQEAYVIADYDRQEFQIGQALFPGAGKADLKVISPPASSNSTTETPKPAQQNPKESKKTLSVGAIVGIAIGAIALLVIPAIAYILHRRRHSKAVSLVQKDLESEESSSESGRSASQRSSAAGHPSAQQGVHLHEADDTDANKHEMDDNGARKHEIDSDGTGRHELVAGEKSHLHELSPEYRMAEMDGAQDGAEKQHFISELEGSMPVLAELETRPQVPRWYRNIPGNPKKS